VHACAGAQFAPTYHEYVLYSDGSQEAPQRYRVRTFEATGGPGQELQQVVRPSSLVEPGAGVRVWPSAMKAEPTNRLKPATALRPSLTTVSQLVAGLAEPVHGSAADSEWSQPLKPPTLRATARSSTALGPHVLSSSDTMNSNDFNPRALPDPDPAAHPADPGSSATALCFRPPWGHRSFESGSRVGVESRRESGTSGDDVTELTKLTNRRASEHGPLMDTIDIGGENEEYSEGFIQR